MPEIEPICVGECPGGVGHISPDERVEYRRQSRPLKVSPHLLPGQEPHSAQQQHHPESKCRRRQFGPRAFPALLSEGEESVLQKLRAGAFKLPTERARRRTSPTRPALGRGMALPQMRHARQARASQELLHLLSKSRVSHLHPLDEQAHGKIGPRGRSQDLALPLLKRISRNGRSRDRAQQMADPVAIGGDGLDHGDSKEFGERLGMNLDAALAHLVHHVQDEHHRPPKFDQLERQQKRAAKVLRIGDLHDDVRLLPQQQLAGHAFILRLRNEVVGRTGAQALVGVLEEILFGAYLVPWLQSLLPPGFFHDLLVGPYGLISMGLTYAIAIILPIVGTFFLAFGVLEDSGYLPRLAILSDRLLRVMGLNGKAILPMVLGLGCDTMATMTTRILNTPRERLIATLLLALGVPCSAQLGVILGIAAAYSPAVMLTVFGVVASQLVLVGHLASRVLSGERSDFIFELPPLRVPLVRNILLKTWLRLLWFLAEVVPLFLGATLALFLLDRVRFGARTGIEAIEEGVRPLVVGWLHLPAAAARVFLMGFLRRDYGAAGLFDLAQQGALTTTQIIVSLVVITLFVPCLANFLVIVREQGWRRALAIVGFILPFAFAVGGALGWILRTLRAFS